MIKSNNANPVFFFGFVEHVCIFSIMLPGMNILMEQGTGIRGAKHIKIIRRQGHMWN